jgi:hypothetical protein
MVPVIIGLILWLTWSNGGNLPIPLPGTRPSLGGPAPSAPSDRVLPEGVQNFVNMIRTNVVLVATGVTVAVVAIIMLSGIWADTARTRRDDVDETYGQGDSDAPWLDDYH